MQDIRRVIEVIRQRTTRGHRVLQRQRVSKGVEDSFDYNETDDQLSAIRAIKYEWNNHANDRLLCGDVGYGKTEVAMRALQSRSGRKRSQSSLRNHPEFPALRHSRSRFAQFPINIEMISRFRTAKEQKDIVARVRPASDSSSAPTACSRRNQVPDSACWSSMRAALWRAPQRAPEANAQRDRRSA